jgi:hypothetical protein
MLTSLNHMCPCGFVQVHTHINQLLLIFILSILKTRG